MNRRDSCYIGILHSGIVGIRMLGYQGLSKVCAIEADHLHNIPNYIGSDKDELHQYYIQVEVPCYLKNMKLETGDIGLIAKTFYGEHWKILGYDITIG